MINKYICCTFKLSREVNLQFKIKVLKNDLNNKSAINKCVKEFLENPFLVDKYSHYKDDKVTAVFIEESLQLSLKKWGVDNKRTLQAMIPAIIKKYIKG